MKNTYKYWYWNFCSKQGWMIFFYKEMGFEYCYGSSGRRVIDRHVKIRGKIERQLLIWKKIEGKETSDFRSGITEHVCLRIMAPILAKMSFL